MFASSRASPIPAQEPPVRRFPDLPSSMGRTSYDLGTAPLPSGSAALGAGFSASALARLLGIALGRGLLGIGLGRGLLGIGLGRGLLVRRGTGGRLCSVRSAVGLGRIGFLPTSGRLTGVGRRSRRGRGIAEAWLGRRFLGGSQEEPGLPVDGDLDDVEVGIEQRRAFVLLDLLLRLRRAPPSCFGCGYRCLSLRLGGVHPAHSHHAVHACHLDLRPILCICICSSGPSSPP